MLYYVVVVFICLKKTSRKISLELIELPSINKVILIYFLLSFVRWAYPFTTIVINQTPDFN